jgi:hypothetical protein
MRRDVRTFRHVAHVAEITAVDDFPVALFRDAVELSGCAFIDQVEELGKRRAEIHTAPAPVADVVNPAELRIELLLVVEIG